MHSRDVYIYIVHRIFSGTYFLGIPVVDSSQEIALCRNFSEGCLGFSKGKQQHKNNEETTKRTNGENISDFLQVGGLLLMDFGIQVGGFGDSKWRKASDGSY